jgi:hypothetical protein
VTARRRAGASRFSPWLVSILLAAGCARRHDERAGFAAGAEAGGAGTTCGALGCTQYDDAGEAFDAIVAGHPAVLAIGEAHAPRDAALPSAAARFARDLLPRLHGRASDLLVELMMPPAGCDEATRTARAEQAPVTARQAVTDQGEYVAMGERARALGIVPDMLRPTCADLSAIAAAGDDSIDVGLRTIARLSEAQAERLVARDTRSAADRDKMVVVYGGALHNRLPQPAGDLDSASPWSYAAPLDALVGGRLLALTLVVPEFIGDDPAWRSLPWWEHYDRTRLGAKVTVFRTGERSYTLVFAVSPPTADAGG